MTMPTTSPESLVENFSQSVAGVLPADKIDSAVQALKVFASSSAYVANANVFSAVVYVQLTVNVIDGNNFDGKSDGISSPGAGEFLGSLFTNDIDNVYLNTSKFHYSAGPTIFSLSFLDGQSNLLGYFQSGGLSSVIGTGSGSGHWG